jgi:hypothetical protein
VFITNDADLKRVEEMEVLVLDEFLEGATGAR